MEERPIAIYSRKSRFTGQGESIENQIEMCRAYLRAHYGDSAAASALVYEDEGFSGGNLDRPQFKRMMDDAARLNMKAVTVYRLDRISRNIGDFASLIQDLGDLGVAFISIREQFDTASPLGRAMMYISSVFSQLERETIAERIRDNMRELAKSGRWLGGVTPTGFAADSMSWLDGAGKQKKACRLRPIPRELAAVRAIYDVFLATCSLTETAAFLNKQGFATKNGNSFTRYALKAILTNPVYLTADAAALAYFRQAGAALFSGPADFDGVHGVMAYNRTLQQAGRAHQLRPMNEWIVAVGAHPGIIHGSDWVQAQALLERNRRRCSKAGEYSK